MSDRITPRQFRESDGVQDWRVVGDGARTVFTTGSFAAGVALVDRIGALADSADHHPDVTVRYPDVAVRLISHDVGSISERDVRLARQISQAARELGVGADPSRVQTVGLTLDATVSAAVMPFWAAVLGYDQTEEDVVDPRGLGPGIWFQDMDSPRAERNRFHVDVFVPADQAQLRVDAALAAGGRIVSDAHAPQWWTLADAEGNEVDVACMDERD